ncbi:MAG: ABC transporter permease [Streptosporangiales bacterium]|nr:ABC transporter permease [Streptosporangiales bacterium]
MTAQGDAPAQRGGVIHDIGYRRYEGARLGRGAAVRALFSHSVRAAYGFGRPGRAKILPFALVLIMLVPAAVSVAVVTLVPEGTPVELIPYSRYAFFLQAVVAIYLAAQAPQAVSRDQRFRVLPLYFSRPILRTDYVLAKFAALGAALFGLMVAPLLVLYGGALLTDHPAGRHTRDLLEALVSVAVLAAVLAAVGLVIAAFTPRRGFGVAAVIAVYLLSYAAVNVVQGFTMSQGDEGAARWAALFTPFQLADGVRVWLFGGEPAGPVAPAAGLAGAVFPLVALALVLGCLGLMVLRYRRVGLA